MEWFWNLLEKSSLLWWLGTVVVLIVGGIFAKKSGYLAWRKAQNHRDRSKEVAVAIVHRGADVLMVKRRSLAEKLTWQFPAGQMRPKDSAAVTAVREVADETGVEVEFECMLSERLHPDTKVYVYYAACRYVGGQARLVDAEENQDVEWVPAAKVSSRITTDLDPEVKIFLAKLG